MLKPRPASMAMLLALLVLEAGAQTDAQPNQAFHASAATNVSAADSFTTDNSNYVIGAQDILDVSVWK